MKWSSVILKLWFQELLEFTRTKYWFIISVPIYRNLWSIKTILYFSLICKYFNLFNEIVFESLYTSHTVMLIEYYFLFGFFWNLWEFRAIIQLSLRSSDVDIHVCDEEYILWRSAGGSLSLVSKEFLSFVCFLNTPLKVLQGLDRWYFDDSML